MHAAAACWLRKQGSAGRKIAAPAIRLITVLGWGGALRVSPPSQPGVTRLRARFSRSRRPAPHGFLRGHAAPHTDASRRTVFRTGVGGSRPNGSDASSVSNETAPEGASVSSASSVRPSSRLLTTARPVRSRALGGSLKRERTEARFRAAFAPLRRASPKRGMTPAARSRKFCALLPRKRIVHRRPSFVQPTRREQGIAAWRDTVARLGAAVS
jgi:hypothetical protein